MAILCPETFCQIAAASHLAWIYRVFRKKASESDDEVAY
jgi:hypothetical protein